MIAKKRKITASKLLLLLVALFVLPELWTQQNYSRISCLDTRRVYWTIKKLKTYQKWFSLDQKTVKQDVRDRKCVSSVFGYEIWTWTKLDNKAHVINFYDSLWFLSKKIKIIPEIIDALINLKINIDSKFIPSQKRNLWTWSDKNVECLLTNEFLFIFISSNPKWGRNNVLKCLSTLELYLKTLRFHMHDFKVTGNDIVISSDASQINLLRIVDARCI